MKLKSRGISYTVERGEKPAPGITVRRINNETWVTSRGRTYVFTPDSATAAAVSAGATDPDVRAPMTGKVVAVRVKPKDAVKEGDVLLILEAMKMEYRLAAPFNGSVAAVSCKDGDRVELGQVLVRVDP